MQKSFLYVLSAALVAAPIASLAAPATDQEKFEGKVERFTNSSSFADNPKRLCVCIDDDNPDDERAAGVLVDDVVVGGDGFRRIRVRCFVRRFTSAEASTTAEACSSTWAPLR
jgi:hypothetical protein